MGYVIHTARSGAEAILVLDKIQNLDLLMTDVVMPGGINGRELAEEARAVFPRIKILFVSGYAPEALKDGIIQEAHAKFLPKPYTGAGLLEYIENLLAEP